MANTLNISSAEMANQLPAIATTLGPVVPDQPFRHSDPNDKNTWVPIYIRIGRGAPDVVGDLVVELQDGYIEVIPSCVTAEYVPAAKIKRVLSSATINDTLYTTTCEKMTWFGGSR